MALSTISGTTGITDATITSAKLADFAAAVDLNGVELILDADGNTSISADTDDQIDIKISGSDDFTFTANAFNVLTGSHATFADSANAKFGTGSDMLLYHDGSNSYITNAVGALKIATETSGIAVTIGHTTSETTVADNLTVTGNGSVGGTLGVTGAVTLSSTLGSGAITSTGIVTGTGFTAGSAVLAEAELELLDGLTAGTAIASKVVTTDSNIDTTGQRNLTISGELDAATLDVSGNADIDGTLEADAYTVDGTALNEYIADTVGAMVTSNTESGITVAYQDGDNTLDFTVGTLNQDTSGTAAIATAVTITDNESTNENNAIIFAAGGDVDGGNLGLESDGNLTYNPSTGTLNTTNISVTGTQTIVNSVTMNASNAVIFEGATADAYETTLTTVDATADHTIQLPNLAGYIPVLASASTTQITTTPAEINLIDGGTARGTTALATGDGILINDGGTMAMTNVDTVRTYMEADSLPLAGGTLTGRINGADGTEASPMYRFATAASGMYMSGSDNIGFSQGGNKKLEITTAGATVTGNITVSGTVDGVDIQTLNTTAGAALPKAGGTMTGDLNLTGNSYNILWDQSENSIKWLDNARAKFGTGGDLQIWHDSANSIIKDDGVGDLLIYASDQIKFLNVAGSEYYLVLNENGAVQLYHNGSEKLATSAGGVTVTGNIANTSGNLTIDCAADLNLDVDGADINLLDGGTQFGALKKESNNFAIKSTISDGDLLIQGTDGGSGITACTFDMSAAGAATFNNDVTAFSDERLKSNIETIPNALDKVCAMRGVTFTRDDNEDRPGTGVIAQEIQDILPEVVKINDDENQTLSVSYGNMVGVLIEAIKELKDEIDTLKKN